MRDRNHLDLLQFNIQLTKTVLRSKLYQDIEKQEEYFSHKSSLWRSDTKTPNSEFRVVLPKDFRLLRALSISLWYFPQNIQTLYRLQLENQTFSWLNEKQKLELSILLSSKENSQKYLYLTQRYTSFEIFGNFLGNDLNDLKRKIKVIFVFQRKAKKKVFRRAPKDKGTRRSDSSVSIIEKEIQRDVWINEKNIIIEKKNLLLQQTLHRILQILENYSAE